MRDERKVGYLLEKIRRGLNLTEGEAQPPLAPLVTTLFLGFSFEESTWYRKILCNKCRKLFPFRVNTTRAKPLFLFIFIFIFNYVGPKTRAYNNNYTVVEPSSPQSTLRGKWAIPRVTRIFGRPFLGIRNYQAFPVRSRCGLCRPLFPYRFDWFVWPPRDWSASTPLTYMRHPSCHNMAPLPIRIPNYMTSIA